MNGLPPHRGSAWVAVEKLADLEVAVTRPAGGGPRVELVDRRLWCELVSLSPVDALELAGWLRDAALAAVTR